MYRALDTNTNEHVAVKKLKSKFKTWEESMSLPEVKALIQLKHPFIVKLNEVVREHNVLYMVFEVLDQDLGKMLRKRKGNPLSEDEVRSFTF